MIEYLFAMWMFIIMPLLVWSMFDEDEDEDDYDDKDI